MDINIPKCANGYIFVIKELYRNKEFSCKECRYADSDEGCSVANIAKRENSFIATSVIINVRVASGGWYIASKDTLLVDTRGYVHTGQMLCKDITPNGYSNEYDNVVPLSQADYVQIFPELPDGVDVSAIVVQAGNNNNVRFEMNPMDDIFSLKPSPGAKITDNSVHIAISNGFEPIDWKFNKFTENLTTLKVDIYSRFNNILTSTEAQKLDNKIRKQLFSLGLELENIMPKNREKATSELSSVSKDYESKIAECKGREKKKHSVARKVEELMELSPRDFEEYIAALLSDMGYKNVELTPYSNDKGVDVLAEKDGLRYAVQCKRYKGTVGSPDMQKFLGAMQHAGAEKGIFVTTGMFSFEAEKMAYEHPIELINRIELAKIILSAFEDPKQ